MEIIISGRHMHFEDDLKDAVEEKLGALRDEYSRLTSLRVVFHIEHNRRMLEAHLFGKNLVLNAEAESDTFLSCIDIVADKLERQLRKHLDRIQDHRIRRREELFELKQGESV